MKEYENCRSCYKHIAGVYAVKYFSFLMENNYIRYKKLSTFYSIYHKLPLLITKQGIKYFGLMGLKIESTDSVFACLDSTEGKPHLGGKIGEKLLQYLINKNFLSKMNKSRILKMTPIAKRFFEGDLIHE